VAAGCVPVGATDSRPFKTKRIDAWPVALRTRRSNHLSNGEEREMGGISAYPVLIAF